MWRIYECICFPSVFTVVFTGFYVYSYRKEQHLPEQRRCYKGCKAGKFVLGQIMPSHYHISFQTRFKLKAHMVIVNRNLLNQLPHKALVIFCNSCRMLLKECFKFIELLKCTCVCCIFKKEFLLIFSNCIYLVKKLIDATSS